MTKIFAIAALAAGAGLAQASIGPGSIAFTGYNADDNDDLAFVTLVDLPAGTVINFTDNEWNGTTWNDSNENGFSFTTSGLIAAGSVITLDAVGTSAPTSALGTIAPIAGAGTNLGLAASNEAVYAFIGDYAAPSAFLAAFGNDTLAGTGASLANTGLTEGVNALFIAGDNDGHAYTGLRNDQTSFAAYLAQINNAANWATETSDGTLLLPFDTTAFVIPSPGAIALAGLGGLVAARRRRA